MKNCDVDHAEMVADALQKSLSQQYISSAALVSLASSDTACLTRYHKVVPKRWMRP